MNIQGPGPGWDDGGVLPSGWVRPPEDDIALTTFTADDGVGGVDRYVRIRGMEPTEWLDLDEARDLTRPRGSPHRWRAKRGRD